MDRRKRLPRHGVILHSKWALYARWGAVSDARMRGLPMDRTTATAPRQIPGSHETAVDEATVRQVERWALVAGVTGCTANGLLLALYAVALPGNHDYDWTGPANDVIGAASALATIPVARGVTDLLGSPGRMPLLTDAVTVGGVAIAAASGLLVTKVIGFPPQAVAGAGYTAALLLWTGAAGRWGQRTGVLPPRLAGAARIIAAVGMAGLPIAAVGAALPRRSVAQYAVAGPGLAMTFGAFVSIPVWQILLSRSMSSRQSTGDPA